MSNVFVPFKDERGIAMANVDFDPYHNNGTNEPRGKRTLWQQMPYVVVLSASVLGVAYANVTRQNLSIYWQILALTICGLCIYTEWSNRATRQERFRLIWIQLLHWGTILIMMNIMLFPGVQSLLPAPANSLVLLMLLALGTFLAGINLLSLQICFLGLAMGLSVAAIAWLKQFALFLILGAVFVIGLALAYWPKGRK